MSNETARKVRRKWPALKGTKKQVEQARTVRRAFGKKYPTVTFLCSGNTKFWFDNAAFFYACIAGTLELKPESASTSSDSGTNGTTTDANVGITPKQAKVCGDALLMQHVG